MKIYIILFILLYNTIYVEGKTICYRNVENIASSDELSRNSCVSDTSYLSRYKLNCIKILERMNWNVCLLTCGTYLTQGILINVIFILISTLSQKLQYELNVDTGSLILGKCSGLITLTVGGYLAFKLSEAIIDYLINTDKKWSIELYNIISPNNHNPYSIELTENFIKNVSRLLYSYTLSCAPIREVLQKVKMSYIQSVIPKLSVDNTSLKSFSDGSIKPSRTSITNTIKRCRREMFIVSLYNLLVFKMLNGQLHSFTPSEISHPGAFAMSNLSLEADGYNYATKSQKKIIQEIGKSYGCHTCGFRSDVERYIADHQPPSGMIKRRLRRKFVKFLIDNNIVPVELLKPKQHFYPQCNECSNIQSKAVLLNRRKSITHYSRLRPYHLCSSGFLITRIIFDTKWRRLKRY